MEEKTEFIGISDDRLRHMLAVAKQCYKFAKEDGLPEEKARSLFTIGFCHDIGYEFSKDADNHNIVGHQMIKNAFQYSCQEILQHGKPYDPAKWKELEILNKADMTVSPQGKIVPYQQRLEEIKIRYGEQSLQYQNCKQMCDILFS